MAGKSARYIIGIDLGTTNSAVGYVDLADASPEAIHIKSFEILQLVGEGHLGKRFTLPSFLYLPDEKERLSGTLSLPWEESPKHIAGEFARARGLDLPGRMVSSAKSWLCHGGVERKAKILPWGADDVVEKVSPIEVSSAYLHHMRQAWNHVMDAPMEEQDVVLTVPASFDEVARELTLEAAKEAGLKNVTLLEEPLAAFYAWLSHNEERIEALLKDGDLILVFDVGGGTTDFTLVRCNISQGKIQLERQAVGDHLLLGGDNIDLALTAKAEKALGKELKPLEWQGLLNQIRAIKERLLEDPNKESELVRIAGRGRGLVAGTLTAEIKRAEVLKDILEGFFPEIPFNEPLDTKKEAALREMGLPFENDPAVTRHLLRFIKIHGQGLLPNYVLFNGGALKPEPIREKLLNVISSWAGTKVKALTSESLDLAISRGAAYYGLSKLGLGLKVGGGIPRAYYIGVKGDGGETKKAVCVLERGTEEGSEVEVPRTFKAITNKPVSFKLYSSTTRKGDSIGDVVEADELHELPPLVTVLKYGKKGAQKEIPVNVRATVTAIGTLELFCVSSQSPHRWRLQFDLRAQEKAKAKNTPQENVIEGVRVKQKQSTQEKALSPADQKAIEEAGKVLKEFFDGSKKGMSLTKVLQDLIGMEKNLWTLPLLRAITDILLKLEKKRALSPPLESQWFNLTGYTLRPGVGDSVDPWRIKSIWPIWFKGLYFPNELSDRLQWWIFWRRVAAGLSPGQQEQIFGQISKVIFSKTKGKKGKKGSKLPKLSNEERKEILFLVGALEKIDPQNKVNVGELILEELAKKKIIRPQDPHVKAKIWLLGKIGSRSLFYGPQERTVSPNIVSSWLKRLRTFNIEPSHSFFRAMVSMARFTGDRARDLTREDREDTRLWLQALGANDELTRPIVELIPLEEEDRSYSFGEELPLGLVLEG